MNNEKAGNIHDVDPAENLHKKGLATDKMVGDKWVNERQQPSLVTEGDRKTGEVSADATSKLRQGQQPTNMNQ